MSVTIVQPLASRAVRSGRSGASLEVPRRWHLLSLDAPSVAVLWLLVFSKGQPGGTRAIESAALALAVWLLYVGDRILDARRSGIEPLQARHLFHARYLRRFAVVAVVSLLLLPVLLLYLPATVRTAWLCLAVPMALYALAIHRWPVRRMPKELVVAVMFATATALPGLLAGNRPHWQIAGPGCLFALVCWLNCVAIARWEGTGARGMGVVSRSTAWGADRLLPLCVGSGCVAVSLSPWMGGAAVACGLSALLLIVLDRLGRRLEPVSLRALADAALLTPLLCCFVR